MPGEGARRGRSRMPAAVLLAASLLVALLAYGVVRQQQGVGSDALDAVVSKGERPAAPALDLERPLLDGSGTRRLADLAGGVTIVNFWASWCGPCREEAPALRRTQERLERSGQGTVLGVTYHDAADASRAFLEEFDLRYLNLRDPEDKLFEAFGNRGIPETFVLDARGRVVALARGAVDQDFLDQSIARAERGG